jgi:hypothetical protein
MPVNPVVKIFTYALIKILIFNNTPPFLEMLKMHQINYFHIMKIIIFIYNMHN